MRRTVPSCVFIFFIGCSGDGQPTDHDDVDLRALGLPLYGGTNVECPSSIVSVGGLCTGVALEPRLVVYAAHCGTRVEYVSKEGRSVTPERCKAVPNWTLPERDLAYCLLKSDLVDTWTLPTAVLGCEASQLEVGARVTVVGRGEPSRSEAFADLSISEFDTTWMSMLSPEGNVGACGGDSGGGVFLDISGSTGSVSRLVGVISAGPAGCAPAAIYATRLDPFIGWLEKETQLDLTPCGDADGSWNPGPLCTSSIEAPGPCLSTQALPWSLCGKPYERTGARQQGALRVRGLPETLAASGGSALVEFDVVTPIAVDFAVVDVSILEVGRRSPVVSARRSLRPYEFGPFELSPGSFRVKVRALAPLDESMTAEAAVVVVSKESRRGCAIDSAGSAGTLSIPWILLTFALTARRRAVCVGRQKHQGWDWL